MLLIIPTQYSVASLSFEYISHLEIKKVKRKFEVTANVAVQRVYKSNFNYLFLQDISASHTRRSFGKRVVIDRHFDFERKKECFPIEKFPR